MRKHHNYRWKKPHRDTAVFVWIGCDSLSRMTPTSGSLFLLRISQRAKGSSGVSGSSLNSRVTV